MENEISMPKLILTITTVLIVLGVGIFAFLYIIVNTEEETQFSFIETFTVSDPSQDQQCTLSTPPDRSTMLVEHYSGSSWETISSIHITVDRNIVTVDSAGLFG